MSWSLSILLTVVSIGIVFAKFNNKVYQHGWGLARRNSYSCAREGDECSFSFDCCTQGNICYAKHDFSGLSEIANQISVGVCTSMRSIANLGRPYLFEGETCTDSLQCYSVCCRAKNRHRMGVVHVCDKAMGPYRCVIDATPAQDQSNKINPF